MCVVREAVRSVRSVRSVPKDEAYPTINETSGLGDINRLRQSDSSVSEGNTTSAAHGGRSGGGVGGVVGLLPITTRDELVDSLPTHHRDSTAQHTGVKNPPRKQTKIKQRARFHQHQHQQQKRSTQYYEE